jgi:hypothetical protein
MSCWPATTPLGFASSQSSSNFSRWSAWKSRSLYSVNLLSSVTSKSRMGFPSMLTAAIIHPGDDIERAGVALHLATVRASGSTTSAHGPTTKPRS